MKNSNRYRIFFCIREYFFPELPCFDVKVLIPGFPPRRWGIFPMSVGILPHYGGGLPPTAWGHLMHGNNRMSLAQEQQYQRDIIFQLQAEVVVGLVDMIVYFLLGDIQKCSNFFP